MSAHAGIGNKMARGAAWMTSARIGVKSIGLVSTIILARLLVPEDFGVVALAMIVIVGMTSMTELSFNVFLIAKEDSERRHYDAVWTLSLLRGALIGSLLWFGADRFAGFFDEPRVADVIRWLAIVTVIDGFENPGIVNFRKEFRFSRDFIWMISTTLANFVVTLTVAIIWRNYWALVAGMIAGRSVSVILSYIMHPFRPRLSLRGSREVLRFSVWLLLNHIIQFVGNQGDRLILGKLMGAGSLGVYTVAMNLAQIPGTTLLAPLRRAMLPGYAKLATDRAALGDAFLDNLALIAMVLTPAAIGIGLVADPLVYVVLGEKWMAAAGVLEVLVLAVLSRIIVSTVGMVFLSIGRPQWTTVMNLVAVVTLIPLLLLLVPKNQEVGAAAAVAIAYALEMFVGTVMVCHVLGVPYWQMWVRMVRTLISLCAMGIGVLWVRHAFAPISGFPDALVQLLVLIGVGAGSYALIHLALWCMTKRADGPERTVLTAIRGVLAHIRTR